LALVEVGSSKDIFEDLVLFGDFCLSDAVFACFEETLVLVDGAVGNDSSSSSFI
jgi:hypothetical protein